MPELTVIQVTITDTFNGRGRRNPWSSHYACTGPDGTRFTNSDKVTLKQVLARRYGKVQLEMTDLRQHGPARKAVISA